MLLMVYISLPFEIIVNTHVLVVPKPSVEKVTKPFSKRVATLEKCLFSSS